jgi:hypothetical protein
MKGKRGWMLERALISQEITVVGKSEFLNLSKSVILINVIAIQTQVRAISGALI